MREKIRVGPLRHGVLDPDSRGQRLCGKHGYLAVPGEVGEPHHRPGSCRGQPARRDIRIAPTRLSAPAHRHVIRRADCTIPIVPSVTAGASITNFSQIDPDRRHEHKAEVQEERAGGIRKGRPAGR